MRKIPKAIYMSADELDACISEREAEANGLPPGPARQSILKEVAQLRSYADMKRWVDSPLSRSAPSQNNSAD